MFVRASHTSNMRIPQTAIALCGLGPALPAVRPLRAVGSDSRTVDRRWVRRRGCGLACTDKLREHPPFLAAVPSKACGMRQARRAHKITTICL